MEINYSNHRWKNKILMKGSFLLVLCIPKSVQKIVGFSPETLEILCEMKPSREVTTTDAKPPNALPGTINVTSVGET